MDVKARIEFQRRLIQEVKKHTAVRLRDKTKKREAWKEIEVNLNFPAAKLEIMWMTLSDKYTRILSSKAIQRDTSFPDWELFHDMSFLYTRTRLRIKKRLGGLQPPLLVPPAEQSVDKCPCCLQSENVENGRDPKRVSGIERFRSRSRLIDTIKMYPELYTKTKKSNSSKRSNIWRVIASILDLSPSKVKSRWLLYRQRYVEELMREKQSNGTYKSKWSNYEQMSFMRDNAEAEVAALEKVKIEIQIIVDTTKRKNTDPAESETSKRVCEDRLKTALPEFNIVFESAESSAPSDEDDEEEVVYLMEASEDGEVVCVKDSPQVEDEGDIVPLDDDDKHSEVECVV